ncbi:MAG: hypothetical protein RL536_525 [Candidatus Parcubacteria bacterium]
MNRNVTAIILIVLAIGIYVTFTRAKLAEVNQVREVNNQYTLALANANELIKVRDSVLEDYNNIDEKDRSRLDKMLPNTVDNIRLIIDLNDFALNRGVFLKNVKAVASSVATKPQSTPPVRPAGAGTNAASGNIPTPILDTVNVSFGWTSAYQQGIDFLRDLEADLRIMDVTHLNLTANANGTYDFDASIKTYWLRQQ